MLDIAVSNGNVNLRWGGVEAHVSEREIKFAQFGCKLLRKQYDKIQEFPPGLLELWDRKFGSRKAWSDGTNGRERLAEGILDAVKQSGLSGVSLWDTMRNGSDYWRPGGLLKNVSEILVNQTVSVCYDREDELCPSPSLLETYMFDKKSEKNYAAFAVEYAGQLKSTRILEIAAAKIIMNLARGILPAFYCVDPYLPGYGVTNEQQAGVPYRERTWIYAAFPELKKEGCHRFILAEEMARFFNSKGISVEVFEIDPTFMKAHKKRFAAPFGK